MDLVFTTGRRAHARAEELLDYWEVTGWARELPERLSGGGKQRVAIARALANSPAMILADEPTASTAVSVGCACYGS